MMTAMIAMTTTVATDVTMKSLVPRLLRDHQPARLAPRTFALCSMFASVQDRKLHPARHSCRMTQTQIVMNSLGQRKQVNTPIDALSKSSAVGNCFSASLDQEVGKKQQKLFQTHDLAVHIDAIVGVHDDQMSAITVTLHQALFFKAVDILVEQHGRHHLELLTFSFIGS